MSTVQTTVVINGDALNTLFPEGSQARVDLTRSAVDAILKRAAERNAIQQVHRLSVDLERQIDHIAKKALAEEGITHSAFNWSIEPRLAEAIQKRVKSEFDRVLHSTDALNTATLEATISRVVNTKLGLLTDEQLAARVRNVVASELRNSLAKLAI